MIKVGFKETSTLSVKCLKGEMTRISQTENETFNK